MGNSRRTGKPIHKSANIAEPRHAVGESGGSSSASESGGTNFYALFESVSDAIFLLDGEKVVDCNNKTLEMFACERGQIINQPFQKYAPLQQPDGSSSQEKMKQKINIALSGESQFFEWKLAQCNNHLLQGAEGGELCPVGKTFAQRGTTLVQMKEIFSREFIEGGSGALTVASGSAATAYAVLNITHAGDELVAAKTAFASVVFPDCLGPVMAITGNVLANR